MAVTETSVARYIDAHPSVRVHFQDSSTGAMYLIGANEDERLLVQNFPDDAHVEVDDTEATITVFNVNESGELRKTVGSISKDHIEAISKWELETDIAEQLQRLYPAAAEMVKHYNNAMSSDRADTSKGYRVDVYFLKDQRFRQDDKGSVIIVPRSNGIDPKTAMCDEPNIIKGYVYNWMTRTIKWETVQAWLYQYQYRNVHLCALNSPLKEWFPLI